MAGRRPAPHDSRRPASRPSDTPRATADESRVAVSCFMIRLVRPGCAGTDGDPLRCFFHRRQGDQESFWFFVTDLVVRRSSRRSTCSVTAFESPFRGAHVSECGHRAHRGTELNASHIGRQRRPTERRSKTDGNTSPQRARLAFPPAFGRRAAATRRRATRRRLQRAPDLRDSVSLWPKLWVPMIA